MKTIAQFFICLLACFLCNPVKADSKIICDCERQNCICFVQIGDEGIAVEGSIDLLAQQGYLVSERGSTFDINVYEAVCSFQVDHGLYQSGMLDHETLTILIWSSVREEEEIALVWVPTDGGKKRHSKSNCSGMEDPRKMASWNAQKLGIEPCKRCNPQ